MYHFIWPDFENLDPDDQFYVIDAPDCFGYLLRGIQKLSRKAMKDVTSNTQNKDIFCIRKYLRHCKKFNHQKLDANDQATKFWL